MAQIVFLQCATLARRDSVTSQITCGNSERDLYRHSSLTWRNKIFQKADDEGGLLNMAVVLVFRTQCWVFSQGWFSNSGCVLTELVTSIQSRLSVHGPCFTTASTSTTWVQPVLRERTTVSTRNRSTIAEGAVRTSAINNNNSTVQKCQINSLVQLQSTIHTCTRKKPL